MFCRLLVCQILFATTRGNINDKVAKRAGFLGKSFFVSEEIYQQPGTVCILVCAVTALGLAGTCSLVRGWLSF